jgi:hypothetical protein
LRKEKGLELGSSSPKASSVPSVLTTKDSYKSKNMDLQNEFGYAEAISSTTIARHIPSRRTIEPVGMEGRNGTLGMPQAAAFKLGSSA